MTHSPETRPSLLVRLRDRQDEVAWGEFLEIYEPLIYRLARRKGFQDADAAELTQEVLLAVSSAINRWDPDPARGSFRGWLFTIARNLMINLLAKQRREISASGESGMRELLERQAAPNGQETSLFDTEYKREVFAWAARRVRGELLEQTWRAFWMTSVEGRAIKEVAETLGVRVGVVYAARSRVMARLRRTIEGMEKE
jgi:RNA polymerase sigma factor (sigma-70 family)